MNLWLTCVLCLALRASRVSADLPVVTTSQGRITGTTLQFRPVVHPELARDVDAYLGIPYAEPPVGPLRFKAPVAKSWSGELQATKIGNRCPQPKFPLGRFTLTGSFGEDCLCLDVFVPKPVPPNAAVLVYFHGGGFFLGAGAIEGLLPTPIAAIGDVITVSVNYRLGALGFLSTGDDVIAGNMGLLDQRLALEWVRDNIRAFGGDPSRVAIFGQSAGAASAGLQMVSPGSAGLFSGVIVQSGDASPTWATAPKELARKRAFTFGGLVGCEHDTSEELLECLQNNLDVDTIINNQSNESLIDGERPLSFTPVIDGNFLPGIPSELYENGAINDAVTIIGENADEGMCIITPIYQTDEEPFINSTSYDSLSLMCTSMVSKEPIVAKAIKMMYTDATCTDGPGCNYLQSLSQVCGDIMFVRYTDKVARSFTKAGRKVYRYHFTHTPTTPLLDTPPWAGATHSEDLTFVFGLPLVAQDGDAFTEEEVEMSIRIINHWANLAKTGNPNLSSLDAELTDEEKKTEWPLFTVEGLEYKDLTPEMLNGRGIKAQECRFWNDFIPELVETIEKAKKGRASSFSYGDGFGSKTCTEKTCPED
ncbi:acetylcholinesterase-like [Asterias amurensis]|uniref:acetylcholinesterase-like n=1 Tax=Asterias amurensis TaxID=7602 RepID=UPI003AB7BFA9